MASNSNLRATISVGATGRYGRGHSSSAYHQLCSSSFNESRNLQNNEDWKCIQSAVVGLFQRKKLLENQLTSLRQNIKNLSVTKIGPFLIDFYTKQVLTRGMIILREKVRSQKETELLKSLNETWSYFYSEIIPTVQAIFFPIKPKHLSMRQLSLVSFRDVVLLKVAIGDALDHQNEVPSGLKQMLLILQSVHDTVPPNENRLALEKLVARVVVPYLGFYGLYEGGEDPVINSNELSAIQKRKSVGNRRLSRPWSYQRFHSIDTLEDMFHSAYSRTIHEEDV